MKAAILFDQDGTLLDSAPGIKKCAIEVLKTLGVPNKPYEEMNYFIGPPLRECFKLSNVPEDKLDEAVLLFREIYQEKGGFDAKIYSGIVEALKELKRLGYFLFVCTSKGKPVAVDVLTHFGLAPLFDGIYGATIDGKVTKKKDIIAKCLEENKPDIAIMVGDTYLDVEGANANNIKTIGVTYGYGDKNRMIEEGASSFTDSPSDLLKLIRDTIKV